MRHFSRTPLYRDPEERHLWPPDELLERLRDALEGVELEEVGAAELAADLLRQCAGWVTHDGTSCGGAVHPLDAGASEGQ